VEGGEGDPCQIKRGVIDRGACLHVVQREHPLYLLPSILSPTVTFFYDAAQLLFDSSSCRRHHCRLRRSRCRRRSLRALDSCSRLVSESSSTTPSSGQKTLKGAHGAARGQSENATLTLTSGVFREKEREDESRKRKRLTAWSSHCQYSNRHANMKIILLFFVVAAFASG